LFEAADLQWWWRVPRSTDVLTQLFWFDHVGRPEAAVVATDWGDRSSAVHSKTTLAPILMPDATPDWVAHVIDRGLAHAAESGISAVELEVACDDGVMREVLMSRGFTTKEEGVVEAWLGAKSRPSISSLHDNYRLCSRVDAMQRAHHMTRRSGPEVEQRLLQTSLYRSDLDLFVLDRHNDIAAYGLFWFDPVTATGLVEPMRTEDTHQRKGLARHVLTAGIDLLADAGADRIKIGFEPDNPASSNLYVSVGFAPVKHTDVFAGKTQRPH
jgi:GNAT superfamily N-acetyltransferase